MRRLIGRAVGHPGAYVLLSAAAGLVFGVGTAAAWFLLGMAAVMAVAACRWGELVPDGPPASQEALQEVEDCLDDPDALAARIDALAAPPAPPAPCPHRFATEPYYDDRLCDEVIYPSALRRCVDCQEYLGQPRYRAWLLDGCTCPPELRLLLGGVERCRRCGRVHLDLHDPMEGMA